MKKLLILFSSVLLIFLLIQIIPVEKNESALAAGRNFEKEYHVPPKTAAILSASCYDCHSNSTRYPSYSEIQPAAWFMQKHIKDGKKELNFDDFINYSDRRKKAKIRSIISQIEKDEMPLTSYLLMHKEAKLTKDEKKQVVHFFRSQEK